jgi:hypothetical protein
MDFQMTIKFGIFSGVSNTRVDTSADIIMILNV